MRFRSLNGRNLLLESSRSFEATFMNAPVVCTTIILSIDIFISSTKPVTYLELFLNRLQVQYVWDQKTRKHIWSVDPFLYTRRIVFQYNCLYLCNYISGNKLAAGCSQGSC